VLPQREGERKREKFMFSGFIVKKWKKRNTTDDYILAHIRQVRVLHSLQWDQECTQ